MQAAASKDDDALLESDRQGQARQEADRARIQEEEGSQASRRSPGYYEKRIILTYMTPGPGRDKMHCHQQIDLTVQIPWTVCDRS